MLLASAACSAPRRAGEGPPAQRLLSAGDHSIDIQHGGRARRYLLHVPPTAKGAMRPVMLALHGGGGHAAQFKAENGLDAIADREGFLTVHPDGTGPLRNRLLTWNAGQACCGYALDRTIDDVGFLAAVLEDLAGRTAMDHARVYVTGHSNGAIMAYRFAAERADLVAAIIPVGGAMSLARFSPSRPVAVLDIHSVDDPRALYAGGLGPPFPGTDREVLHAPVMAGISAWARQNGCAGEPKVTAERPGDSHNVGQTATRLVYQGCDPGGEVEHLRLTGSGHAWPGAPVPASRRRLLGPSTTHVLAAEEAWRFAARFRRR